MTVSDLVKRLRVNPKCESRLNLCLEAADEIERLTADIEQKLFRIEQLENALRQVPFGSEALMEIYSQATKDKGQEQNDG